MTSAFNLPSDRANLRLASSLTSFERRPRETAPTRNEREYVQIMFKWMFYMQSSLENTENEDNHWS